MVIALERRSYHENKTHEHFIVLDSDHSITHPEMKFAINDGQEFVTFGYREYGDFIPINLLRENDISKARKNQVFITICSTSFGGVSGMEPSVHDVVQQLKEQSEITVLRSIIIDDCHTHRLPKSVTFFTKQDNKLVKVHLTLRPFEHAQSGFLGILTPKGYSGGIINKDLSYTTNAFAAK